MRSLGPRWRQKDQADKEKGAPKDAPTFSLSDPVKRVRPPSAPFTGVMHEGALWPYGRLHQKDRKRRSVLRRLLNAGGEPPHNALEVLFAMRAAVLRYESVLAYIRHSLAFRPRPPLKPQKAPDGSGG
jgi:hypothetical protein